MDEVEDERTEVDWSGLVDNPGGDEGSKDSAEPAEISGRTKDSAVAGIGRGEVMIWEWRSGMQWLRSETVL
jgi:hypothetical protein